MTGRVASSQGLLFSYNRRVDSEKGEPDQLQSHRTLGRKPAAEGEVEVTRRTPEISSKSRYREILTVRVRNDEIGCQQR